MRRAGRMLQLAVGSVFTSLVLGTAGLVLATSAVATQTMTATTWVNMRSGPSTANGVLAVLAPSEAVTASGTVSGGWYEVTTKAGLTGWVYQTYLRASSTAPSSPAPAPAPTPDPTAPATTGQVSTTAAVNVRSGPSTSYAVVGVATKGQTLGVTGVTSGGWTQVVWSGVARWISTSYLSTGSAPAPTASGQLQTTANLYLRTAGDISAPYTGVLPAYSIVDTTGRTTADYSEILVGGQARWVATRYTKAVTDTSVTAPSTPVAVGKVYVRVTSLYVRATSSPTSTVVATVYKGNELATTGRTSGDRTEIIHAGAARWVYSPYVTATPPTAPSTSGLTLLGMDRLNPNAKAVVNHVIATYPRITHIYGYRASSDYSSDHPNGRAVDIMVPRWSDAAMIDYGWSIARDFQANASTYKVSYIIWRQQIWNAAYPDRGWRWMEDRGSATANHYDHVHVSVRD